MVYVDESGISAGEPYLVVAGAIVHADRQWKALEVLSQKWWKFAVV
jgi:hypothetical protein